MRALRKVTEGPGLELVDIPEPQPGWDDVKIRVKRAGLCGTDLHLYRWDGGAPGSLTPPQTLGHEFSGTIVELGEGVANQEGPNALIFVQAIEGETHALLAFIKEQ